MVVTKELYKFLCAKALRGKDSSVHGESTKRYDMALTQSKMKTVSIEKIINLTNDFFKMIDIPEVINPIYTDLSVKPGKFGPKTIELDYKEIQKDNELNCDNHLIWMKFTKDGYLGIVAASNDCNFDFPLDKSDYNETDNGKVKNRSNSWKYATSGIIVSMLGKEWDEDFILVFPLRNISNGMRNDIECGIGQYLIENDVPILDYYSHVF